MSHRAGVHLSAGKPLAKETSYIRSLSPAIEKPAAGRPRFLNASGALFPKANRQRLTKKAPAKRRTVSFPHPQAYRFYSRQRFFCLSVPYLLQCSRTVTTAEDNNSFHQPSVPYFPQRRPEDEIFGVPGMGGGDETHTGIENFLNYLKVFRASDFIGGNHLWAHRTQK